MKAGGTFILRAVTCCVMFGLFVVMAQGQETKTPGHSSEDRPKPVKNVTVEEFDHIRSDQKTVTLDVRPADQYVAGHIPGAVNIDSAARDFREQIAALDTNHIYLVHCAEGTRSPKACDKMVKLHFSNLYNLEGGFAAWKEAGK